MDEVGEYPCEWRHPSVDVLKVPTYFGVDDEVLYGPTLGRLNIRRVKYWILDLVGDKIELYINLNFTEL